MEIREYVSANWWTPEGLRKKRKIIESKGIPSMHLWRFTTVTFDRHDNRHGGCELTAYKLGKKKLRKFLQKLRNRFGEFEWCWWFQFQADGWPHWHFAWSYKRKLTQEDFAYIARAWGYGRVNTEMINEAEEDFRYSFRYPFKPQFQEGDSAVPDWFADHYADARDGNKPESFARVRFWQTSRGFYTGKTPVPNKKRNPKTSTVPYPVRYHLQRWNNTFQLVATHQDGTYIRSRVTLGSGPWRKLKAAIYKLILQGKAVPLGNHRYEVEPHYIKPYISKWHRPRLDQIQRDHRRTTPQAAARIPIYQDRIPF